MGTVGAIFGEIISGLKDVSKDRIIKLYELAKVINEQNGADGVAIGGGGNTPYGFDLFVLDRAKGGNPVRVQLGYMLYGAMFGGIHPLDPGYTSYLDVGIAYGDPITNGRYAFTDDMNGQHLGYDVEECQAAGANGC